MTSTEPKKTRGMCIATRCTSVEQFIQMFHRFVDEESFFVSTLNTRPPGLETPFSVQLADGTPVLRGLCVVLQAWTDSVNPFKTPGVRLGIKRLTANSMLVFEQLLVTRSGKLPPNLAKLGPATQPGSGIPPLATGSTKLPTTLPPLPRLSPPGTEPIPAPRSQYAETAPTKLALSRGLPLRPTTPPSAIAQTQPLGSRSGIPKLGPIPGGTLASAQPDTATPPAATPPRVPPIATPPTATPATPAPPTAAPPSVPPIATPPTATPATPAPGTTKAPTASPTTASPPSVPPIATPPKATPTMPAPPRATSATAAPTTAAPETGKPPTTPAPPSVPLARDGAPRTAAPTEQQVTIPIDSSAAPTPIAQEPTEVLEEKTEVRETKVPTSTPIEGTRTPGSELILPANPLMNLSDESLMGYVDCTLYEETGNFFPTDEDIESQVDDVAPPPVLAPRPAVAPAPLAAARPPSSFETNPETELGAKRFETSPDVPPDARQTAAPPGAPAAAPNAPVPSADAAAAGAPPAPVDPPPSARGSAPALPAGTAPAVPVAPADGAMRAPPDGAVAAPVDAMHAAPVDAMHAAPVDAMHAAPVDAMHAAPGGAMQPAPGDAMYAGPNGAMAAPPGLAASPVMVPRRNADLPLHKQPRVWLIGGAGTLALILIIALAASSGDPAAAAQEPAATKPVAALGSDEVPSPGGAVATPDTDEPTAAVDTGEPSEGDEPTDERPADQDTTGDEPSAGEPSAGNVGDDAVPSGPPLVGSGPCRVVVVTTPAGSKIELDGEQVGPSPLTIATSCERHKLEVSHRRYQTASRFVTLAEGKPEDLEVALRRPTHVVTVTSKPSGATIYLDGRRAGTTPMKLSVLGFVTVKLEFKKTGYKPMGTKLYSKRARDSVSVRLKRW